MQDTTVVMTKIKVTSDVLIRYLVNEHYLLCIKQIISSGVKVPALATVPWKRWHAPVARVSRALKWF
jgi:hypothetical protein